MEILRGPGMWIPQTAANRILTECTKLKEKLTEKDNRRYNHSVIVEKELLENHRINTVSIALEATNEESTSAIDPLAKLVPQSKHTSQEKLHSQPLEFTKKADVRRAWEQDQIRKKKVERDRLNAAKPKNGANKVHSEELQLKIDAVRK